MGIQVDNKKLEKVSVSTETTIQVNTETRRLDILIEIGQELCLVIENKIYTADHTDQLKAYSTWLNTKTHANKLLIYLTLNGDVSTDGFMGIYTRLSYRKNIRDFLTTCSALPNVDLRFNTTVLQYNEFWENWFMQDDVLNNDIQKRILASKENFEAAQAVFNAFHNAKVKKIQELLGEWQNTNSTNYPVVEGADKLQGKSYNHVLFKWNDDYSFGFEFGAAFFCDLYYGIANTKKDTQNVTPNIPGWLHTSWWPASKYVNDEKIKNLGQNVDLYFTDDGKQTLFDALDNAFQETEALLKRSDNPFGLKS